MPPNVLTPTAPVKIEVLNGTAQVYEWRDGYEKPVGVTPYSGFYPIRNKLILILKRAEYEDKKIDLEIREDRNEYYYFMERKRTKK